MANIREDKGGVLRIVFNKQVKKNNFKEFDPDMKVDGKTETFNVKDLALEGYDLESFRRNSR